MERHSLERAGDTSTHLESPDSQRLIISCPSIHLHHKTSASFKFRVLAALLLTSQQVFPSSHHYRQACAQFAKKVYTQFLWFVYAPLYHLYNLCRDSASEVRGIRKKVRGCIACLAKVYLGNPGRD